MGWVRPAEIQDLVRCIAIKRSSRPQMSNLFLFMVGWRKLIRCHQGWEAHLWEVSAPVYGLCNPQKHKRETDWVKVLLIACVGHSTPDCGSVQRVQRTMITFLFEINFAENRIPSIIVFSDGSTEGGDNPMFLCNKKQLSPWFQKVLGDPSKFWNFVLFWFPAVAVRAVTKPEFRDSGAHREHRAFENPLKAPTDRVYASAWIFWPDYHLKPYRMYQNFGNPKKVGKKIHGDAPKHQE